MQFLSLVVEWLPQLLRGVLSTLRLMVLAFLVAAVLALPIALARMSSRRYLRVFAHTYVEIIRGMPSLTLLFLIYFGLPSFGITLNAVDAAIIGLGLNGAAYVSEIYRAGIQAIEVGQREAAQMIGMRSAQNSSVHSTSPSVPNRAASVRQLRDLLAERYVGCIANICARTNAPGQINH